LAAQRLKALPLVGNLLEFLLIASFEALASGEDNCLAASGNELKTWRSAAG
jgi:hypothetical protein